MVTHGWILVGVCIHGMGQGDVIKQRTKTSFLTWVETFQRNSFIWLDGVKPKCLATWK